MQAIEVCPIISDVCCFSKFREKNTEVFNNITTKLVRWQGRRYQQAFIATREDCRQTTMLDNKTNQPIDIFQSNVTYGTINLIPPSPLLYHTIYIRQTHEVGNLNKPRSY